MTAVAAALVTGVIVLALSRSRIEGQRQRAVAAEQQARDALIETRAGLTRSLDQSAVAALLTGDLAAAESFAAAALTHGESVDARGVLAATRAGSRPAAALRLDLPGCGDVIPDDDQYALCRSRDHLELWQLPADHPRWRQRLSATRAVSLHGRWVAALEVGSSAALLDGKTGDVRLRVMVGTTVDSVVRARDGNRAAFHDRHRIWLVDPDRPDATAVRVIDPACAPSTLDAVALGAARAFAVCGDGRVVSITDDGHRTTIARLVVTAADQIASVAAIDEDERTLGFGRIIGDVALVDLATGAVTAPVKLLDERVAELQLVAGMIVVVGERGGARVWNRALDAELLRLPERAGRLLASSGDHLITGGAGWWRWSLAPPPMPRRFVAPAGLSSAAISPDGTRIAAARGDGRISIWSTATGDLIAQPALAEAVIKRLDFSPDGQALAVGISSTPGSALLATGTWQRLPHQPSKGGANRLSYLADGELIAVHYVRSLTRWRPGYARDEIPVTGFIDAEPTASRDALWLLARAGQVARYRAGIVTDVFTAPGAESLAPSSDGRRVAVGLPDGVELHDLVAGTITPLVGSGDRVLDVAISPGDRWLAAANAAGTLDVWSLPDGRWVAHLRGHQQRVAWVGFAAGALWSASWDGAVQRWDLAALAATPAALAADAAATWALP